MICSAFCINADIKIERFLFSARKVAPGFPDKTASLHPKINQNKHTQSHESFDKWLPSQNQGGTYFGPKAETGIKDWSHAAWKSLQKYLIWWTAMTKGKTAPIVRREECFVRNPTASQWNDNEYGSAERQNYIYPSIHPFIILPALYQMGLLGLIATHISLTHSHLEAI